MIIVDGKKIIINDVVISLPYKIEQNREYVILNDRIIIVYDTDEFQGKNNIDCYSLKGEKIWTVKTPSKKLNKLNRDCLFVGISLIDDSCRVIDYWGRNFLLNIYTGELSDLIWVR